MNISIMLTFHDEQSLNQLRKQFDPLYSKVPPHVTLVFPQHITFESIDTIISEINKYGTHLENFTPIVSHFEGDLEYHNILAILKSDNSAIKVLHDKLYEIPEFADKQRLDIPYTPHVTIGRDLSADEIRRIVFNLSDTWHPVALRFKSIVFEEILPDDSSKIIYQYTF
ncbi:2'-5' RNA ligase family protein [Weissella confusa]|uniref:2'-5' RNA ligase family protein n=1 Tax=Weissella confusa TaxID=1583 RepID=UPI0018F13A93|nr:2'-5' RNA ligase family protein [Weissella confusa]MBJ7617207.1 hypothetical protein [Weissella confusa]